MGLAAAAHDFLDQHGPDHILELTLIRKKQVRCLACGGRMTVTTIDGTDYEGRQCHTVTANGPCPSQDYWR